MTLRLLFPVAPHSYFRAVNKLSERRAFLTSDTSEPVFKYPPYFKLETINERLAELEPHSPQYASLSLVKISATLQDDETKLAEFRKINATLFGKPRPEYAYAILQRIAACVTPETRSIWREVVKRTGKIDASTEVIAPSDEIFARYRQYLRQYVPILKTKDRSLVELMKDQLHVTGLDQRGWDLKILSTAVHAKTNHKIKQITLGEFYEPRTVRAKKRIVTHEVFGHAIRGQQASIDESEGFATVLEQLVDPKFKYRRSYRYLAVSLGWGALGTPMTFREVFEIMWRVMMIGSKYSQLNARKHAFDECYRAFRGGRPDMAGAAFLKDAVYFDANIRMWDVLINQELSYNEFVDIIEGRRTLLS